MLQRIILFIVSMLLVTACATSNNIKKQKKELSPEAAFRCIHSAIEQELSDGSSEKYNPDVELTEPFNRCWDSLHPLAKQMYSPLLAEAAMEQGNIKILEETCGVVIKQNPQSPTAQKCKILIQSGLVVNN